ncbi:MAG: TIR domain-containing protein [Proteobacteria bacterium]|nr:TIR domain-containing protein [Pseudomonadota bacterium]
MTTKRFQVALSFPGEHRNYVSQVAEVLAESLGKDKVFYDQWHTAELARPDMDVLLQSLYHDHSGLLVPFLCADYERKEWCGLELRAIRDLIKKQQSKDIMPMRFDNAEIPGFYSIDGYVDLNDLAPQRAAELILQRLQLNQVAISKPASKIFSDRLPTVKGEFFGREAELKLLNDAWAGNGTRIIQFIAPGGTGKTKLLRHWLDHHTNDIDTLIAWSFYSQGSSEDKQVSASPFFSHAFDKLGSVRSLSSFATEEDKGEHLADLLRQQRGVLVLDGLEPLQHAGKGMRGELKDRAIRQLLRSLSGQNNGLCIITTRIAVHELSDRTHVIAHDLQNLTLNDGVKLLQSLGIQGSRKELEKAVMDYGCHALALSLLGNVLRLRHKGDVLKRNMLKDLVKADGNRESRHAFKVMQAYEEWFADEPELALLYLLGLFDHPIGQDVLQVLWDEQIPNLTAGISEDDWLEAIATLREEHHLLSQHNKSDGALDDQLDCHPLIREYFGKQLREKQPDTWRQAHTRLYEYYKTLPQKLYGKELLDTLEEMQPLFSAVTHGCAAGLHQQAFNEVFFPLINHKDEYYLTKKLGAFSDDLAALAHFFTIPWNIPASGLTEFWQADVLGWAGYNLRALGRLCEALEPIQAAIDNFVKQENWLEAAKSVGSLSQLQLNLGNVKAAVSIGKWSMDYADKSRDSFQRMSKRTIHADALHQAGEIAMALELFQVAEQLQQEFQPEYPRLYSLEGFRYCILLLSQGKTAEVLERAEYDLDCWTNHFTNDSLTVFALPKLVLGCAYFQKRDFQQAFRWLDQAVASLRVAGYQEQLPSGLLARAALYRDTRNPNRDFTRARQDLQEVYDIAEPSGMRLHLTDYHLEMARLLLAEREDPASRSSGNGDVLTIQAHVTKAAKLIEETGYKRRLPELQELQHKLSAIAANDAGSNIQC